MTRATHNCWLSAVTLSCMLLAGCQAYQPPAAQWDKVPGVQYYQLQGMSRVDPTPIQSDAAMKTREDWPTTPATYGSLSMTTGSPLTPLEPSDKLNTVQRGMMETPLFVLNILISPATVLLYTPLWAQVQTPGLRMPQSYTANPPQTPINAVDYSGRALTGGWETVRTDKSTQ